VSFYRPHLPARWALCLLTAICAIGNLISLQPALAGDNAAACNSAANTVTISAAPPPGLAFATDPKKLKVTDEKVGNRHFVVARLQMHHSREEIWDVLTDYAAAPKIFKNVKKSEILAVKDNTKRVHQTVKPVYFPFTFDYQVVLTENKPGYVSWEKPEGSAFAGFWKLEATKDKNVSNVTYGVHIISPNLVPTWILMRSLRGYMPEVFRALQAELTRRAAGNDTQ